MAASLFLVEVAASGGTQIREPWGHVQSAPAAWDAVVVEVGGLDNSLRLWALTPQAVVHAAIPNARGPPPLSSGTATGVAATRPAAAASVAPFQACQVGLTWRSARRRALKAAGGSWAGFVDVDPTTAPTPGAPTAAAATALAPAGKGGGTLLVRMAPKERHVKLIAVLDQGDDLEVARATVLQLGSWLQVYGLRTCAPPAEDAEPTLEQLTALDFRVRRCDRTPFADFGVWCPFGRRGLRANELRCWFPAGDGTFFCREVSGPENLV